VVKDKFFFFNREAVTGKSLGRKSQVNEQQMILAAKRRQVSTPRNRLPSLRD
jgi:hypothetical protein